MNVLIVDKDKAFTKSISKILKNDKGISKIYIYENETISQTKLTESQSNYELSIIDLDSINQDNFFLNDHSKYIVYSSNSKTIKKYINNPQIQRIFQKPINLQNFTKYLNNYCNLLHEDTQKGNIYDSLISLGFSTQSIGTTLLADSIKTAKQNCYINLKEIFSIVAKKNNTTSQKVLWSINNAINGMLISNYRKTYIDYFKIYDGRKPTPKFIIDFFVKQSLITQ